ncbi:Putative phage protein [Gluconobacter oxydans 621H]|uniref:Putative phage protein n=1 Tax=Gluconobacter oxydans (strain 621H) TaxID=290633 RepID=Q5FNH1_GLUOX|nr:hypothetical protein [Gluconobacter oxydans]AAW62076.1 Putative phage protein [Gluconobacter oxydans 621H]
MTRKDHKLAVEVAPGRRFRHDGELLEEGDIVVLAAKEARQMVACGHCLPACMPMTDEDMIGPGLNPDHQDEENEGVKDPNESVSRTNPMPPLIESPPPKPTVSAG